MSDLDSSMDQPVTALRVANEAFLVSSTIERCPKTMMIRELVVNAIEAASLSQGIKRVDILAVAIDGVSKLCIRNTGPGLSAQELDRICDLASSLNKENSLDANFGMGAKVASLPSNRHGLRYRSCKGGVVSEVILGERAGLYGRLRRGSDADGKPLEVLDVTDECRIDASLDLAQDWTEVVLFGNSAIQNTVIDPYGGNPRSEPGWLVGNLMLRFFRIPGDVMVMLAPEVVGGAYSRRLHTLADVSLPIVQSETVRTPSGVSIHYRYDPREHSTRANPPFDDSTGFGCIVFKDEIYDPRVHARWTLDAPTYGISFGAKHISVFVELPDDYLVRPEAYRQFLRFRGGDQRQMFLHDFGQLVTAFIPGWLKAVSLSHGPKQADFLKDVADELRTLLEELDIAAEFAPARKPPLARTDGVLRDPAPAAAALAVHPPKQVMSPRPPPKRFEKPPEIIGLETEQLIEERGLKGRAAKFYPSSHQVFVNLQYAAFAAVASRLETEFHAIDNPERVRAAARSVAGWAITRRIARALIYSLSKKSAGWPAEDVRRAQSPESLSLAADDWSTVIEPARVRMALELVGDVAAEEAHAGFTTPLSIVMA